MAEKTYGQLVKILQYAFEIGLTHHALYEMQYPMRKIIAIRTSDQLIKYWTENSDKQVYAPLTDHSILLKLETFIENVERIKQKYKAEIIENCKAEILADLKKDLVITLETYIDAKLDLITK